MTIKTMTMAEIRESLAKDDAESIQDYRDRFDIFLNGCPGYNNYENDDCIDYYIQRHYPAPFLTDENNINIDDENPIIVLEILDDGNGQVFAKVIQHKGDVQVEFI